MHQFLCERDVVLFVPSSLKKKELEIIQELQKNKLEAGFRIADYDPLSGDIKYELKSVQPKQQVSRQAKLIVLRHLKQWQELYNP